MRPDDRTPLDRLGLLAVDLETTGLSPARDHVLAVGWVPVDGARIDLSGARRHVVRRDDPGDAVTIHGLTHDDLGEGRPLAEVLADLERALSGRVLLAHHAPFELAFLDAAFRSVGRRPALPAAVCTLELQRRLVARHREPGPGELRLWRARERHGLPVTAAHDALGDALACAELYLAQSAELAADRTLCLRDVRRHEPWLDRLRTWWRARR
ncbi:DNA polymerase III subunit epsilon [Nocardioides flavus (ex Wang et al. 2016)]|uniref:DNA polymerase III subunit epsilon n=1 Tax=Nocardioides flavus (ex Wang et al. 2016) TaxID=2058780 RepID=A0ABQ3HIC0_9ACTN|nr:3'-5' exonuclease [Nocardioides flavus (ex Wang et al. 2016)]GHE16638.1 DNA polymerase III subunit epsilon [Nocardioides flavus (ex Wang et al. 2016)]